MSEEKTSTVINNKTIFIKRPLVLKKDNFKFINTPKSNNERLLKQVQHLYREDVIFETSDSDFLKGESQKLTLLNKLNKLTNSCRTIARYSSHSKVIVELTSDNLVKLIGQKNYDTVYSTLLSVINQEQKIKSVLALLTNQKKLVDVACGTELSHLHEFKHISKTVSYTEHSCQTDEAYMEHYYREKPKRKSRRQRVKPYVVKEPLKFDKIIKKIVINPEDISDCQQIDAELEKSIEDVKKPVIKTESECLPQESENILDLKFVLDDDSLMSDGSLGNISLSGFSVESEILGIVSKCTKPEEVNDFSQAHFSADTKQFKGISKNTVSESSNSFQPCTITVPDGSRIKVTCCPKDLFHIATQEILKNVTREERIKLMFYQAYIDWKNCLTPNEDNNLPIHTAVLNNDLDLLRRQCLVLKQMPQTIDTMDTGITALQMSILMDSSPHCTSMLLRYGADLFHTDDENKTAFHLAAEGSTHHLQALIDHCTANARKILQDNEELWNPALEKRSDEDLAKYLLSEISVMSDEQGYTPLMLASRFGKQDNVSVLVATSPGTVNTQMPNCGNTALYLAVEAACLDAADRSNKSKVSENFITTIENLILNGANPSIDNYSGSNVNLMLTECNVGQLSMLISDKLVSAKTKNFNTTMLHKDSKGEVKLEDISEKETKPIKIEIVERPIATNKPTITNVRSLHDNGQLNGSQTIHLAQNNSQQISINVQHNRIINTSVYIDSGNKLENEFENKIINKPDNVNKPGNKISDEPGNILIKSEPTCSFAETITSHSPNAIQDIHRNIIIKRHTEKDYQSTSIKHTATKLSPNLVNKSNNVEIQNIDLLNTTHKVVRYSSKIIAKKRGRATSAAEKEPKISRPSVIMKK